MEQINIDMTDIQLLDADAVTILSNRALAGAHPPPPPTCGVEPPEDAGLD
jgi:hypothetical protein